MKKITKYYWIFALVYFAQGIHGLPGQGISYWLKETLKLTVSQLDILAFIIGLAWLIKPIWGFISDRFPIFHLRRKSYLIINYLMVLIISLYIYLNGLTVISYVLLGSIISFAFAFNDVCIDGSMVEIGQNHNILGKIQSIQWLAISISAILVGSLGGWLAENISYQQSFGIVFIIMIGVLICTMLWYKEEKFIPRNKMDFKVLVQQLKNKKLWLAIGFLFCLYFSPSFGMALFYKMRDQLHFSKLFIGHLITLTASGGAIGALIYNRFCNRFALKKMLIITTILSGLITLCYLYYPNWKIAMLYAVLFGMFGMITQLVILVFAASITPKYSEAFIFAGLCSILNLGSACSALVEAWLYPLIGLNALIVISSVFTFGCLGFIKYLKLEEKNDY